MVWGYLMFTLLGFLLFTFLGFFIGIYVCLFYRLGVKPLFDAEKDCVGHAAPNRPIPDFTPPKPKNLTKVNVDRYGNEIHVGDTVWYQGEKWSVYIHDYSCDSSLSEIHKYHLFNGHKYIINVSLGEIKKVVRADSINNAA